jgi:hypothetical protein
MTPMITKSRRGGVLLVAMCFVVVFAIAAASILGLSLTSHRSAMRNELQAQARAVAQSELETLFFKFRTETLVNALHTEDVPAALSEAGIVDVSTNPLDYGFRPTTEREAFLAVHRSYLSTGWRVFRSLRVTQNVTGWIPAGQTAIWGNFIYVDAKIEVRPPADSLLGESVTVRVGREFVTYRYTIFQHAIFYQGDLEMYPGRDVTVSGDVVANGSIYMGGYGGQITLTGKVSYLSGNYFNSNEAGEEILRDPNAPVSDPPTVYPIFDPNLSDGITPDQAAAKAAQLKMMEKAENFIGGIDPVLAAKNPSNLFGPWDTAENLAAAINNVYRSSIVPPPEAEEEITPEYPNWTDFLADNPVIGAQRVYSRAGLRITIDTTGTCKIEEVTRAGVVTDKTSTYNPTDGSPKVVTDTTSVWDKREGRNVTVTEIDIATLKTILDAVDPDTGVTRSAAFNGILYVNLKSGSADSPSAVRLINGASTPYGTDSSDPTGFAVATNGGLYIKGNYNSTAIGTDADSNPVHNPAMLMGDAMTVLSPGWDDANDAGALSTRIANTTGNCGEDGITPEADMQKVYAGLVTGNNPPKPTADSGGVQNLVRYLEDWTGKTVEFHGSLGRLFNSKMFTRPFVQPGTGVGKEVYNLPASRNFIFDRALTRHPPPGSPMTDGASRGRYYNW